MILWAASNRKCQFHVLKSGICYYLTQRKPRGGGTPGLVNSAADQHLYIFKDPVCWLWSQAYSLLASRGLPLLRASQPYALMQKDRKETVPPLCLGKLSQKAPRPTDFPCHWPIPTPITSKGNGMTRTCLYQLILVSDSGAGKGLTSSTTQGHLRAEENQVSLNKKEGG